MFSNCQEPCLWQTRAKCVANQAVPWSNVGHFLRQRLLIEDVHLMSKYKIEEAFPNLTGRLGNRYFWPRGIVSDSIFRITSQQKSTSLMENLGLRGLRLLVRRPRRPAGHVLISFARPRSMEPEVHHEHTLEILRHIIYLWIYVNSNGSLFKPGFVLGEDVCKIMYVTVHVTNHVTLAVLELAVLGSCLLFSSCHFQMRHCQMKPIDDVCEKSCKKSCNIWPRVMILTSNFQSSNVSSAHQRTWNRLHKTYPHHKHKQVFRKPHGMRQKIDRLSLYIILHGYGKPK